jgi:hypothetical protein
MIPEPSKSRPTVATLAMLALLLLTVGAAWLLVRFYHTSSREGALLVQEMRTQRLHTLWPAKPYSAWFARQDRADQVQGRLHVVRRPTDGGFEGEETHLTIPGRPSGPGTVVERWFVSDDLAHGRYKADYETGEVRVTIDLENRKVTLTGPGIDGITEDAPAHYLPEGVARLAVRMVAASGRKAAFVTISNEASVQKKRMVFFDVVMTPVSPREVRVAYELGGAKLDEWIFHLDGNGEVIREEGEDGTVLAPIPAPVEEGREEGRPAEPADSGAF